MQCVVEETCPTETTEYYPELNLCKDNQCFRTFVLNLDGLNHTLYNKYNDVTVAGEEPALHRCVLGCVDEAHG